MLIEKNIGKKFQFVDSYEDAEIIWDHENSESMPISVRFYDDLKGDNLEFKRRFLSDRCILDDFGRKDVVATIFYLVNCIQEICPSEEELDHFGRFRFEASCQAKFDIMDQNLVQHEIDGLCNEMGLVASKRQSRFFISHDIDSIYGSFLQDGLWAVKNMKVGVILNLIAWEICRNPHWKNIDKVLQINNEYDVRSTFFWLAKKGVGSYGIKNADYDLRKEKDLLINVQEKGSYNGLHKTSFETDFATELQLGGLENNWNRYHFLKFRTHEDWANISNSPIEFDCSLGFAEHYGFRNSFGMAFQPYDIKNERPYDFVEAPLHFMDGTFSGYMGYEISSIANLVIQFYERNSLNCDLSILWHNTHFSMYKYGGYLQEYKKILAFLYEAKLENVSPIELINENKLLW
jgi:hypothetical protein